MREQGVQERTEQAALGGTGDESQGGGCGAAYPHSLGSAGQEVQDPTQLFIILYYKSFIS